MNNRQLGEYGETIAKHYLIGKGYKILTQNFRCSYGEIDIIAQKDDNIVFVEVKTRRTLSYGTPAEAVDRKKQMRYGKIASLYIKYNRLFENSYRFDIIEVYMPSQDLHTINHIENAFGFTGTHFFM
ncbi:MAG TPA: YraN family protein [Clostridiales bacterium]|nr:YraN family protein [Clostridiales bacterium]